MSTRVMSETRLSATDLLQSIDDKNKANFDSLEAKIISGREDMAAIRAELAGVRGSLQSMSKKLDDILHIVKWVLPHF